MAGCLSIKTSKSGLKNPKRVVSVIHFADDFLLRLQPIDRTPKLSGLSSTKPSFLMNRFHLLKESIQQRLPL